MRKLTITLFFLLLCAFVLEFSLGVDMSTLPGLSFKNLAILALALVMLAANASSGRPIIARGPINVPAMLFIVYCTISLFLTGMFHVVPDYSIGRQLLSFKLAMDPYVLLVVMFSLVHDERTIDIMLRMLVGVLIAFLLITVLGSFNIISVGRVYLDQAAGRTRGAFSEWNQYPLYVVTFMPLVVALMLAARNNAARLFYAGVLALCGYNVMLAGSRGALVSLAAAVAVYYLLASRRPLGAKIINLVGVYAVVLVGMVALAYVLPGSSLHIFVSKITGAYFESGRTQTDYSSGRLTLWMDAWRGFLSSPIYGTGWRTFIPMFGSNSHNDYLLYLTTTGIIGLSLFVFVFVRMLKTAFRHRKRDPAHRYLYNSFVAAIAAYMTGSFFVNIFTPAYFVFIYAALVLRLGYVVQQVPVPIDESSKAVSPVLPRPRGAVRT